MVENEGSIPVLCVCSGNDGLGNSRRSFTDLKRDHILFSMATPSNSNGLLVFWDEANKELEPHIKDRKSEYRGQDYKPNTWHSICTTWDSESGLVQIWFNSQFLMKKYSVSGSNIQGTTIIILGQVSRSIPGFTR